MINLKEANSKYIAKLKTLEEYKEEGEEITDLIEMFAGHYVQVLSIDENTNEFGEKSYLVEDLNTNKGIVSVTDHEIKEIYKEIK